MNPLVILMAVVAVANGGTPPDPCNGTNVAQFLSCGLNIAYTYYDLNYQYFKTQVESCFPSGGICSVPTQPPPTPRPGCNSTFQTWNNCVNESVGMSFNTALPPFDCSGLYYLNRLNAHLQENCDTSNRTLKNAAIRNITNCINGIRGKNAIKGVKKTYADYMFIVNKPYVMVCDAIDYCNGSYPISNACFAMIRRKLCGCQQRRNCNIVGSCGVKDTHPLNFCTNNMQVCKGLQKNYNRAVSVAAANAPATTAATDTTTNTDTTITNADTTTANADTTTTATDTTTTGP